MTAKLSLNVIHIPEPCEVPWENMRGDDRARFCDLCHKNVYDFSAITAADANALLEEHGENLCAQWYVRADGTIQTADCTPDRLADLRRRARRTLGFATSALGGTLAAVVGLAQLFAGPPPPEPTRWTQAVDKLLEETVELQRVDPVPTPQPVVQHHDRRRGRIRVRNRERMRGGIRALPEHGPDALEF